MSLTAATTYAEGRKPLNMFGKPTDKLTCVVLPLTFDSSYPTGGESFSLAQWFSAVKFVEFHQVPNSYRLLYDITNSKVIAYYEDQTSGVYAQVANTTDLSTALAGVIMQAWGLANEEPS